MRNIILIILAALFVSCTMTRKLNRKQPTAAIEQAIPTAPTDSSSEKGGVIIDTTTKEDTPVYAMGRYSKDGELEISINIKEVTVRGRSRNISERDGKVQLKFDLTIPQNIQDEYFSVLLTPVMSYNGKVEKLAPLIVKGESYNFLHNRQNYFFEKYVDLARIKGDTSQVTQKKLRNFLVTTELHHSQKLDTIIKSATTIRYQYTQEFPIKEDIKQVYISFDGQVKAIDNSFYELKSPDTIKYNISSLTRFLDLRPRYIEKIVDRVVKMNDKRFIAFAVGKYAIVDSLDNNKAELSKITSLMDSVANLNEYIVDSIELKASASPEGAQALNHILSLNRANALTDYINAITGDKYKTLLKSSAIGEDWEGLKRLIESDTIIQEKGKIIDFVESCGDKLDFAEMQLRNKFPDEYTHIKNVLYPKLRAVNFRYNLTRVKLAQDTIKTTELDQTYLRAMDFLKSRKFGQAIEILQNYNDRNYAFALLSINQNQKAINVLNNLPKDDNTLYLLAVAYARIDNVDKSLEFFKAACKIDKMLRFRAGLDPELQNIEKLIRWEEENI